MGKKLKYLYRYIKSVSCFELLGFIKSKLLIHIFSDLKKTKELENIACKKRCFIIATGPSLSKEDVELLNGEDTIGVNSIFLMYDKTTWRPTYYVCTDAEYFRKIHQEYAFNTEELSKCQCFLNIKSKKNIKNHSKLIFLSFSSWNRAMRFQKHRFSYDLVHGLYAFGTVTNIAISIAMYVGYKEIYLLGADCSDLNRHFEDDITDKEKTSQYLDEVVNIQLKGYSAMKEEAQKHNVKIYNATRGGALEVFPRINLNDVLKEVNNQ